MCLGIPGRVVAVSDAEALRGIVEIADVRREINLHCIVDERHPVEQCVGAWVLVHVGFAMSRIDEAEAQATLALLAELDQMQDELDVMRVSAKA